MILRLTLLVVKIVDVVTTVQHCCSVLEESLPFPGDPGSLSERNKLVIQIFPMLGKDSWERDWV